MLLVQANVTGAGRTMAELKYPNESVEYRAARDALLEAEKSLAAQVKAVAAQRRELPRGGKITEDYVFVSANDPAPGKDIRLSELFGDKNTLLLYSYMFGPNWDKPCLSCTSIVDGFERAAMSVTHDAAFAVVTAATHGQLNDWARSRGWQHLTLVSAEKTRYLRDYHCQTRDDDKSLWPVMHVFTKRDDGIYHFWGTEMQGNSMDMVWAYWNLMDMTPDGRPDRMTPPQDFRSKYLEEHYLPKD